MNCVRLGVLVGLVATVVACEEVVEADGVRPLPVVRTSVHEFASDGTRATVVPLTFTRSADECAGFSGCNFHWGPGAVGWIASDDGSRMVHGCPFRKCQAVLRYKWTAVVPEDGVYETNPSVVKLNMALHARSLPGNAKISARLEGALIDGAGNAVDAWRTEIGRAAVIAAGNDHRSIFQSVLVGEMHGALRARDKVEVWLNLLVDAERNLKGSSEASVGMFGYGTLEDSTQFMDRLLTLTRVGPIPPSPGPSTPGGPEGESCDEKKCRGPCCTKGVCHRECQHGRCVCLKD